MTASRGELPISGNAWLEAGFWPYPVSARVDLYVMKYCHCGWEDSLGVFDGKVYLGCNIEECLVIYGSGRRAKKHEII